MDSKHLMSEQVVQDAILDMLLVHPKVGWMMAITTGRFKVKGGHITVGHFIDEEGKRRTGMSDLMGQLVDGRLLAIEVKRPGNKPTKEQLDYIDMVNANGGLAFWSDNVSDAKEAIDAAFKK